MAVLGATVGSKIVAAVQKEFKRKAEDAFSFLVDDCGFMGPERCDLVMQQVAYARSGVRCRVSLDHSEMRVLTEVEVDAGDVRLVAGLEELISSAGIHGGRVRTDAHTSKSLEKTLHDQANYLRLAQAYLTEDAAVDVLRKAGAREWRNR